MSLKTLFNKIAMTGCMPEKPVVLACTLNVDENSGDCHGYTGIGKVVAQKLGGEFRHLNDDMLHAEYPKKTVLAAMCHYYQDHGVPDIILTLHSAYYFPKQIGVAARKKIEPLVIKGINEALYQKQMKDNLVAHHVTPDALKAAGTRLVQAHPDLNETLITVMMADSAISLLAKNLVPRLHDIPSASIFVCSGRRTSTASFSLMMNSLTSAIESAGRSDTIKLHGYNYEKESEGTAPNPYLGLLDRSNHIVVCGSSLSMVSEALSTQHSIYLYGNPFDSYKPQDSYASLIARGMIDCSLCDHLADAPLKTKPIALENPTEIVADHVIRDYAAHYRKQVGYFKGLSMRLMG